MKLSIHEPGNRDKTIATEKPITHLLHKKSLNQQPGSIKLHTKSSIRG